MRNKAIQKITRAAITAAAYTAITVLLYPISSGLVQIRVAEALMLLPMLYPETAAGLFVGCLLSNFLGGGMALDIIFGSLATLIAALVITKIKNKWLAPLPSIICNGVIVGIVMAYATVKDAGVWQYLMWIGSVSLGEAISCYGLGIPLITAIEKYQNKKARG